MLSIILDSRYYFTFCDTDDMSDTVTDTIACIGKKLINNHKLCICIVICPILSDTIPCVSKKFAYIYDGFIRR
jgi:hypothetical protein